MTNYDFIDDFINTYKLYANDYEKGRYEMGWSSQQREYAISKAREYRQLAEWLEELKSKRNIGECVYKQGYNKAIDDFLQELINYGVLGLKDSTQWRKIHDIASQVRESGKNEMDRQRR